MQGLHVKERGLEILSLLIQPFTLVTLKPHTMTLNEFYRHVSAKLPMYFGPHQIEFIKQLRVPFGKQHEPVVVVRNMDTGNELQVYVSAIKPERA
jgi:hypothetical protein